MFLLRISEYRWVNPESVTGVSVDADGGPWVSVQGQNVAIRADLYDGRVEALLKDLAQAVLERRLEYVLALGGEVDALRRSEGN